MKKLIFLALLTTLLSLTATAQYEKKVQAGDTLRATVHPDRGYELVGWYIGEQLISTQLTLVYVPTADATFRVVIRKIPITVTLIAQTGGTVTGAGNYEYGDAVNITATANYNYEFTGWYIDNELISTESNYTLGLTDNVTVVAHFKRKVFLIIINVQPAGSGTIEGEGVYEPGADVRIEAFPALMWKFSHWDVEGTSINDNPYFFTAGADHIITANMSLPWWGWLIVGVILFTVGYLGNRIIYFLKIIKELFKR
jgi:uncharacterized repeat protein (TIGR02543 family)